MATTAPLASVSLLLQVLYVDETGEPRHVHSKIGMFAHATAAGSYTALFHVEDPIYRRRFELTGEYGLGLNLVTQLGVGSGVSNIIIAGTVGFPPDEVRKLVERTRKPGARLVYSFPGFTYFGLPEDRAEIAVTFSVELVYLGRAVCVRKIEVTIPERDALAIAVRLALHKVQINGLAGDSRGAQ